MSFFWQPKRLHQHGKMAAGAIIGGISVSAAFSLGGAIATWLGLNFQDIDVALGLGFGIGVASVGVIGWWANFLSRREDMDVLEVATEVHSAAKGTPLRKARARKATVRRKPVAK